MIKNLFLNIIEITISMSFIISILLLLSNIIDKKYNSTSKYFIWLIISLRLAIPFNIFRSSSLINITLLNHNLCNFISSNTTNINKNASVKSATNIIKKFSFMDRIILIWLLGALIFLTLKIISYLIYKKKLKRWCNPIISYEIKNIFNNICNKFNINNNIKIFKCRNIKSPMLIGFINPIIVLPTKHFNKVELNFIFKHELIHYKKHDIWYKLLLTISNALHWFNPIVWIMVKQANYDLEASCDEKVLLKSDIKNRQIYAKTILKVILHNPNDCTVFTANFYGGANIMKKRFENIVNTKKKKAGIIILSLILILSTFSNIVFAFDYDMKKTDNINYENCVVEFLSQDTDNSKFNTLFNDYVGKNNISYNKNENSFYFNDKKIWILCDKDATRILQQNSSAGFGIFLNVKRNLNGDIKDIYQITKNEFTQLTGWR